MVSPISKLSEPHNQSSQEEIPKNKKKEESKINKADGEGVPSDPDKPFKRKKPFEPLDPISPIRMDSQSFLSSESPHLSSSPNCSSSESTFKSDVHKVSVE